MMFGTRSKTLVHAAFLGSLLLVSASSGAEENPEDLLLGGGGTVFDTAARAFSLPFLGLKKLDRLQFQAGDALFTESWVTAPSSAKGRDGLGPLLNARSCSNCHLKDGRGESPAEGMEAQAGLLLRISSETLHGYGDQLQNIAVQGIAPEVSIKLHWLPQNESLSDGTIVSLRRPDFVFADHAYGPFPEDIKISPRLAPPMIGLGLLEAVAPEVLLEWADPEDKDGNGISGRANYVLDRKTQTLEIGRFGWKANQPNLRQQNAGAFLGDMGLTSPLFPDENCTSTQTACALAPNGGSPEVDERQLDLVELYTRFLGVPARRNADLPEVKAGRELFMRAECQACHRPHLKTRDDAAHPLLSAQSIWPYTDLLLHDMGEDLADDRPDALADGREWRTPPLWGLGLTQTVNGRMNFLHDGRARTLEEAILWHGGEGSASKEAYKAMNAGERKALLQFLNSL